MSPLFSLRSYGKHVSNNSYYFCYEPPKIVKMFERLRRMPEGGHYPLACGRFKVTGVRDLTVDYDSSYPDKKAVSFQLIFGVEEYFTRDDSYLSFILLETSSQCIKSNDNLHF